MPAEDLTSVYGNGCATMSYSLSNCVLRFMEMAGKQFSPFMEMVVQPCLTVCLTASYGLWKWLASNSPRLWKWLCNHVLQLVELCFTVCATASYGLWKWLASSSPHLWKQF
jgi:hypothetical protein